MHHLTLEFGKAMPARKGLRIFVVGFRLKGQQDRSTFSGFGFVQARLEIVYSGFRAFVTDSGTPHPRVYR
jgi:hypothetical protein